MLNIKNDFNIIQNHIKKSKWSLFIFMYTGGIIFLLMTPFVMLHKKHFMKVKESIKILNDYSKENNLDLKFENFSELENSAVLYSQSQLSSLTVKQYERRIEYLESLNDKIETLKKCI
ncbi:hypothetical protein [Romboutsia sp.]|uniref:hypothetical protein n=1 Tax=Romboutsia sp. TaxID=1965302 RepID=UPI003F40A865